MSYELIETGTVGAGGADSIEFTSIPQDGTDLVVLMSLRGTSSLTTLTSVQLNSDNTNANYSGLELVGNGSTEDANSNFSKPFFDIPDAADTSNTFANAQTYIANYTSTAPKAIFTDAVTENRGATAFQKIHASIYNITTPITSIKVRISRSNFAEHSTASLYKITAS